MASLKITVLNAIGCLLLVAVVVVQWMRERDLKQDRDQLQLKLGAAHETIGKQEQQRLQLENDIALLKDSLSSAKASLEENAKQFKISEANNAKLLTQLEAMQQVLDRWQQAVKERDAQLERMNQDLLKTRAKLDEAIQKIKELAN